MPIISSLTIEFSTTQSTEGAMKSEGSEEETRGKAWFDAVKAYHENNCKSTISFLDSVLAEECRLSSEDIRDFRRAVQSFEPKWQAAAKAYIQGKFTTRRQFLSSGKFLLMGFTPSREHAEVLRFALKFYDEEQRYRKNACSSRVTTAGRYGGSMKPMYTTIKTRAPHQVVGFDDSLLKNAEDIPDLVDVRDDQSAESISKLSGDSSVLYSLQTRCIRSSRHEPSYLQTLLQELGGDRDDRNPVDAMIFFIFAIIPLVIFAQLRAVVAIILPFDFLWGKENDEHPVDIEDEWEQLRANALIHDPDLRAIF